MQIKIQTLSETGLENNDWHDIYRLSVDNTQRLFFYDGEVEDNNLARNFNDVKKIKQLLQDVYNAGVANSGLTFTEEALNQYP